MIIFETQQQSCVLKLYKIRVFCTFMNGCSIWHHNATSNEGVLACFIRKYHKH